MIPPVGLCVGVRPKVSPDKDVLALIRLIPVWIIEIICIISHIEDARLLDIGLIHILFGCSDKVDHWI